jgi:two-component system, chemotaxis family, protein-glutamate methylesterase/glutaminase
MITLGQGATMQEAAAARAEWPSTNKPVKVMIVDDSAVVRGLVARWIEEEPGLEVVARHANGKLAVDDVARSAPDVILLDIDMPVMDGLEALPLLLRARPEVKVLVVSTLTKRNAEISFKAMALGALDYVPKPETNREITTLPDFRSEVVHKIKALSSAFRYDAKRLGEGAVPITPRPFSLVPPRAIVIGSSTGGPQALATVLSVLSPALDRVPVLIAQHMPPMFTTILAERLARATGRVAKEGLDGEPLLPGTIYVAPGNHHMAVLARPLHHLAIEDGPPVNFCRPAADRLFASASAVFGPAVLAVVLTGMGQDGAAGALSIAEGGGSVIAQDAASSVVWGMPGTAAAAGACAAILPPIQIAEAAAKLIRGERP